MDFNDPFVPICLFCKVFLRLGSISLISFKLTVVFVHFLKKFLIKVWSGINIRAKKSKMIVIRDWELITFQK